MKFIFLFVFFFVLSITLNHAHCSEGDFYKGLDKFVTQKRVEISGSKESIWFLPSARHAQLTYIGNLRFLEGNDRYPSMNLPAHPQCIPTDVEDRPFFPQTATASLLQWLFPSPNGYILTANQSPDPLGRLNIKSVASILGIIQRYKLKKIDLDTTRQSIFNIVNRKANARRYDALKQKYKTVYSTYLPHRLKRDFLIAVKRYIEENRERQRGGIQVIVLPKKDDPLYYDTFLSKDRPCLYGNSRFSNNAMTKQNSLEQAYQEIKCLKTTRNLSPEGKEKLSKLNEAHAETLFFDGSKRLKNSTLSFLFADLVLKAIAQSGDVVEQALMSFFWKKAKDSIDVISFYSELLSYKPAELKGVISSCYSPEEYIKMRESALQNIGISDIFSDPEKIFCLCQGYEIFDNPLPPFIPYDKAKVVGRTFSDCVEISLLMLTLLKARVQNKTGYSIDPNQFKKSPDVQKYMATYAINPQSLCSFEAHDAWAVLVAGNEKGYALRPGYLNCFRVLAKLFPDLQSLAQYTFKDGVKGVESGLVLISKFLSHEKYSVELTLKYEGYLDPIKTMEDYVDEVSIKVNGDERLIWKMEQGHSSLKVIAAPHLDWRKKLGKHLQKEKVDVALLPPFFSESDALKFLFSLKDSKLQLRFAYHMDLRGLRDKVSLFQGIYRHKAAALVPLALNIVQEVDYDGDEGMQKILQILFPMQGMKPSMKPSILTQSQIVQVLKRVSGSVGSDYIIQEGNQWVTVLDYLVLQKNDQLINLLKR